MISDGMVVALLSFCGLVVAGLIAAGITLGAQLVKWQVQNHRLWLWNRQLVDHIYQGNPPPPPPPPADLFD